MYYNRSFITGKHMRMNCNWGSRNTVVDKKNKKVAKSSIPDTLTHCSFDTPVLMLLQKFQRHPDTMLLHSYKQMESSNNFISLRIASVIVRGRKKSKFTEDRKSTSSDSMTTISLGSKMSRSIRVRSNRSSKMLVISRSFRSFLTLVVGYFNSNK